MTDTGGPGVPGTCFLHCLLLYLQTLLLPSLPPGLEGARRSSFSVKPGRSPIIPEDAKYLVLTPKPFLWALEESGSPIPSSKFGSPAAPPHPPLESAHSLGDDRVVE